MKILMFGHKYVPSRNGGIEVVVDELATRMTQAGHELTLLNRRRKEGRGVTEYNGYRVQQVFAINRRGLDALVSSYFATRRARKLAKKGLVDIVHVHAEGPCLFLKKLDKKNRDYKIVVTIHGLDWQRGKWGGFAQKILKKGEAEAVKHADEIIVLSENVKDYFLTEYGRETTFIPNGVGKVERKDAALIQSSWRLEKGGYVLFLARIVPEKGLHYLVEAWQSMTKEERGGKKLVIAGESSHSDKYCKSVLSRAQKEDSVVVTGKVEGDVFAELFSNAYLYVLPSDVEGMPMSLLEAMNYGNYSLTSDIAENVTVVGDKGISFRAGDVADLKDKLIALIAQNVERYPQSVAPYFWEDTVEQTVELYEKKHEDSTRK